MDLRVEENVARKLLQPCRAIHEAGDLPAQRTYIIMGSGRGGTSMVAGAMAILGISMDSTAYRNSGSSYNLEDFEIVAASQGRPVIDAKPGGYPTLGAVEHHDEATRMTALCNVIMRRNAQHRVWGFKDPMSFTYLDHLRNVLVNPHFIVVYRDMMAIAEREYITTGCPIDQGLKIALDRFSRIENLIDRWKAPTLCVSFERATQQKSEFCTSLCEFTGLPIELADDRELHAFLAIETGYKFLDPATSRPIIR